MLDSPLIWAIPNGFFPYGDEQLKKYGKICQLLTMMLDSLERFIAQSGRTASQFLKDDPRSHFQYHSHYCKAL